MRLKILLVCPVVTERLASTHKEGWDSHNDIRSRYGPMDKAPAYGAGDSGFESR